MSPAPTARKATGADIPDMAAALAAAFADDPVMTWFFGDAPPRPEPYLTRFMAHESARHLRHDEVYTIDGTPGAALWDPPGRWRTGPLSVLPLLPIMVPALGRRIPAALRFVSRIEAAHAKHPEHYYLAILGTRPERRGEGLGSALLRPVLDRCDAEGVGAYLESSKEANIPFYRRHGFEVLEEITVGPVPTLWPMWRDPHAPGSRP